MTRQQEHLARAFRHVEQLQGDDQRETAKIYGGLCHNLPVLLRTNGLCQTLAFIEEKATVPDGKQPTPRHLAYRSLRDHISETLAVPSGQLLEQVRADPLDAYMRRTRTLLEAWVYYKRFAVSVLNVQAGEGEVET